jgi:hypothetical protein
MRRVYHTAVAIISQSSAGKVSSSWTTSRISNALREMIGNTSQEFQNRPRVPVIQHL